MVTDRRRHRANHTQIISTGGHVRQVIRKLHATLTHLLELPGRSKNAGTSLDQLVFQAFQEHPGNRLPMKRLQLGLGSKQVQLARGTSHEEEDHLLGLGCKMGQPRYQRIGSRISCHKLPFIAHQISQCYGSQSAGSISQEVSPRQVI